MLKSYLSSIFILLVMVLLKAAILSNITILPAVPDLLLICTLYFSLQNGRLEGLVTGFAGGLMLDFVSGSPFGLNCLIRCIIGYVAGFFVKVLNLSGVFVPCLIGFLATILKALLVYLVSFLFPSYINTYNLFSLTFAFELGFNTIFTPIIFKLLNHFSSFIVVKSGLEDR